MTHCFSFWQDFGNTIHTYSGLCGKHQAIVTLTLKRYRARLLSLIQIADSIPSTTALLRVIMKIESQYKASVKTIR